MTIRSAALLLAMVATGLQAGTYYIFVYGVMPGLALGADRTYVAAMQQFNVSFMNPWFFATFLGAPLLALVAVVSNRRTRPTLLWAVVGFLFAAATFWITIVVHTPLNDALDAAGAPEAIADLSAVRSAHEPAWVPWNVARMLTSIASLAALGCALLTASPPQVRRSRRW